MGGVRRKLALLFKRLVQPRKHLVEPVGELVQLIAAIAELNAFLRSPRSRSGPRRQKSAGPDGASASRADTRQRPQSAQASAAESATAAKWPTSPLLPCASETTRAAKALQTRPVQRPVKYSTPCLRRLFSGFWNRPARGQSSPPQWDFRRTAASGRCCKAPCKPG